MKTAILAASLIALVGCAGPDGRTDPLRTAGAGAVLGAIGGLAAGAISREQDQPRHYRSQGRSYGRPGGYGSSRGYWPQQQHGSAWGSPQRCDSYGRCW